MGRHIPFLFLEPEQLKQQKLSGDNFHHLIKVLRLKNDQVFIALDNLGNRFECQVAEISGNAADYRIVRQESFKEPAFKLVLAPAITKFDSFEEITDKAVQLGISRLIPLITENTTVSPELFNKKLPRLKKIAKAAAEQSQRIFLPELETPVDINRFIEKADSKMTLVAYEKAEVPLKKVLEGYTGDSLTLICGPEGGFSDKEISILAKRDFPLVSLGKTILRAETAVITGLGNIVYELGERL
jgi:16S rRNA (uracil1498-N3)-methyltransferase